MAKVKVGDTVSLTFDALPDVTMDGKVVRIGDVGVSNKGDISYKVTVEPQGNTDGLRWNMTAAVTFPAK